MKALTFLSALAILLSWPVAAASLPTHVHIIYEARLGSLSVGRAEQHWRIEQGQYTLDTELAPILGPRIRYLSHGDIDSKGLIPGNYAEYRGGGDTPKRIIRFDWAHHAVQYGPPDDMTSGKLESGAQELNVLPFQLAYLGETNTVALQLATGRKLFDDHFGVAETTRLMVMGQGQDARIWRTREGEDKTEVWLAPALANLPVKIIRSTDYGELQLIAKTIEFDSDKP